MHAKSARALLLVQAVFCLCAFLGPFDVSGLKVVKVPGDAAVAPAPKNVDDESTTVVSVSLKRFDPNDKSTHVYKQYMNLTLSSGIVTNVNVIEIPTTVGFVIVQIHTFGVNGSLSYNAQFTRQQTVNGTNIGLVKIAEPIPLPQKFFFTFQDSQHSSSSTDEENNATSTITTTAKVLLVVTAYDEESPVPGGCNLTFGTEIAPYQILRYTENLVTVEAQAPSVLGLACERLIPHFDVYEMHLPELDLTESTYFEAIETMLTADDVLANGTLVPYKGKSKLRTYYSAYPGTGSVYAIVTFIGNSTAAYVPVVSYACSVRSVDDCYRPATAEWKHLCAIALFIGLVLCFCGHIFFKVGLFFIAFSVSITIIFMVRDALFEPFQHFWIIAGAEALVFVSAAILGIFWVLIWEKCGKPLIIILLNITLLGIFVSSTFFNFFLGDYAIFQNDINFWGAYCSIVLSVCIILLSWATWVNIFVCSCLGSLAIVVAIDHYIGSNLRYIFINSVRRATVTHFDEAVIMAPYQWKDITLTVVWVGLACLGFAVQLAHQRWRPPFPPPLPRNNQATERTPLLSSVQPTAPMAYDYNIYNPIVS